MNWRPFIQLLTITVLMCATVSLALAAGGNSISVSATLLSRNNCQFRPPRSAELNFGNLDPTNPLDVSTSASLQFRCAGSAPQATFFITAGNGLHFSAGNRRMQNASDAGSYITYQLSLSPYTATVPKNVDQTLTVNGLINGAGYRYATAGSYTDQIVLSINP